jgi:ferric-dicitrate binding protein FerR (iron transport regulator)
MDKELLYRFLEGKTTPEEDVQVCVWIDASAENRREFEELDLIFTAALIHAPHGQVAVAPKRKNISRLRRVAIWMGQAAAVVALAFALTYVMPEGIGGKAKVENYSIEVPAGERMKINLTDGTSVWLNGGSKLEYPATFAKKSRRVRVSGEALFDVAHDAGRPFFVETFACELRVLGTKFNVEADSKNELFRAALLEGSLKVSSLSPRHADSEVLLRPGELAVYNKGMLSVRAIENLGAYSWVDGIINISGLSFKDIMARLENAFDVKIVIKRETMPTLDFIGGEFRISYGIENVLKILQYGSDFSYEFDKENNVITIL